MPCLLLRSPAKLNLYLKVLNKRPDGYHNLRTLFERVDLYDEIRLVTNRTGKIRVFCDHPHVPLGPKNLVFRVAAKLKSDFGVSEGINIHIRKKIPVAAGLAGGSSNAATTLLGLNKIWQLRLSKKQLQEIGSKIGSDVPFFLADCSWGLGLDRGDRIVPQNIPVRLWHILVVARRKMYSKDVFAGLNLELTKRNDDVNILIRSLKKYNIKRAKQLLANDLETSIVRLAPTLLNVKQRLQAFLTTGVSFSGSGPAVFGVTDSRQQAEEIKKALAKRYSQVFVVRTL